MKKFVCTLLAALLCVGTASALPDMGEIHAKSAILCTADGQVLYESNADEALQPASVTKVMTMLLAMEAYDRGEISLDTMITGSEYACSMGGTQIWLKPGEQLSFDEMMKAIAVGSANDCAVAVAEHLSGTEAAFVEKMNQRAIDLGCTNTQFINANGLDGMGQKTLTSARDMALISCELLKHPKILDYTTIWMDSIRNGAFGLANTNKMLKQYPGMTGLKTGYISEAGFCISATAERDGLSLVAVVMDAESKDDRTADVTALLNYGFANFTQYVPEVSLDPMPVDMGKQEEIMLEIETIGIVVEKAVAGEITYELSLPDSVQAPVELGQEIGTLTVKNGNETYATLRIVAAEETQAKGFSDFVYDFFGALIC